MPLSSFEVGYRTLSGVWNLELSAPRLSPGGIIVLDDYGIASCPGARRAVDDFFMDKPERPLALLTAQALIHKLQPVLVTPYQHFQGAPDCHRPSR